MAAENLMKAYDCLPAFEISMVQILVSSFQAMVLTVNRAPFVTAFSTAFPGSYGANRYNAWIAGYGLIEQQIGRFTFIRTDSPSIVLLSNCQLVLECPDTQSPCQYTNFVNRPT